MEAGIVDVVSLTKQERWLLPVLYVKVCRNEQLSVEEVRIWQKVISSVQLEQEAEWLATLLEPYGFSMPPEIKNAILRFGALNASAATAAASVFHRGQSTPAPASAVVVPATHLLPVHTSAPAHYDTIPTRIAKGYAYEIKGRPSPLRTAFEEADKGADSALHPAIKRIVENTVGSAASALRSNFLGDKSTLANDNDNTAAVKAQADCRASLNTTQSANHSTISPAPGTPRSSFAMPQARLDDDNDSVCTHNLYGTTAGGSSDHIVATGEAHSAPCREPLRAAGVAPFSPEDECREAEDQLEVRHALAPPRKVRLLINSRWAAQQRRRSVAPSDSSSGGTENTAAKSSSLSSKFTLKLFCFNKVAAVPSVDSVEYYEYPCSGTGAGAVGTAGPSGPLAVVRRVIAAISSLSGTTRVRPCPAR